MIPIRSNGISTKGPRVGDFPKTMGGKIRTEDYAQIRLQFLIFKLRVLFIIHELVDERSHVIQHLGHVDIAGLRPELDVVVVASALLLLLLFLLLLLLRLFLLLLLRDSC